MREHPEVRDPDAHSRRGAARLRIAGAILIAAILAGCDRCGDLAVLGGPTACRQDAPKPQ